MNRKVLSLGIVGVIIVLLLLLLNVFWSNLINFMLPADSRPKAVKFEKNSVSLQDFDQIAQALTEKYENKFVHIKVYRDSNISSYEGPKTCLTCHEEISIVDHKSGIERKVNLMENLTTSAHYTFFSEKHPNVYGFNGELADNFAMGKINRPCPKPGSFAMTAWAELAVTTKGDTMSEGCGQCHIGGQYQAPLGEMMPGYKTLSEEKDAIDCLICHAQAYDMNKKQVVQDEHGRRWDQDRSLNAALSVTKPTAQTCLRCHQHNFGGDIYVDEADNSYMQSLLNTGHERPRVLHPGSKRGTPFSPSWDVHAAAGLNCTDCHVTEGHYIAKGTHTTTMMANDLPDIEITCESCHTDAPHEVNEEIADYLNMHTETVACQTCHIPSLHPDNATRRDFNHPELEEAGIYVYTDVEKKTQPGEGIAYVWWNGDATFLGNPIGDNPNGANLYRFYDAEYVWPEYTDFDYTTWYEETMRPIAQKKPSKLYAMKRFNGRQHIDLQNMGPFGGMYVPYNLPTYYSTGQPDSAAKKEMGKSMMKRMYGWMFDIYMMDRFMSYMHTAGWDTRAYEKAAQLQEVEARWLPNDAMLEISHAIRKDGSLTCANCHNANSVIDWKNLGYTEDEIASLIEDPLAE